MSWLEPWRDPRFLWFPLAGSAISVLAFLAFAAPLTLLAWADPPWARAWRVQERRPSAKAIVGPSLRQWAANNALQLALVVLAWPALRHTGVHLGPAPHPAWVAAQVLGFVYLDDLLYWFLHRAMHTRWLYRRVHQLHHRIPAPWAIAGHYMHPAEYLATTALMLAPPVLLGVHVVTLWAWIVVRQWEAAEGHSGYHLPWSPTRWLPGGDGAAHHDFHHSRPQGNFAGFFPLWDRVFGTLSPGYREFAEGRR